MRNQGLNVESGSTHQRALSRQQLRRPLKLGLERHKYNKSVVTSSSQHAIDQTSVHKRDGSTSILDYDSTTDVKQYLDNAFVPKLVTRLDKDKRFGSTGE